MAASAFRTEEVIIPPAMAERTSGDQDRPTEADSIETSTPETATAHISRSGNVICVAMAGAACPVSPVPQCQTPLSTHDKVSWCE